jgi:spermidine/putrescine-binding protein
VTDGTEDLLVEGETVAAHGYSGDFFLAFDEASTDDYDAYEDFGYGIPKEGGVAWVDTLAVPRTANAPCTAHTFINFLLDAENGAALSNYNFYASPNAAATPFVDPEILEDETIYPPDEVLDRLEFIEDTGDFETNYTDAFSAVKN